MKFRSERDALIEMLATAGRAVGARATSSPVLSGLLLSCTGNVLSVTGTDLDLTDSGHRGGDRGGGRNIVSFRPAFRPTSCAGWSRAR